MYKLYPWHIGDSSRDHRTLLWNNNTQRLEKIQNVVYTDVWSANVKMPYLHQNSMIVPTFKQICESIAPDYKRVNTLVDASTATFTYTVKEPGWINWTAQTNGNAFKCYVDGLQIASVGALAGDDFVEQTTVFYVGTGQVVSVPSVLSSQRQKHWMYFYPVRGF